MSDDYSEEKQYQNYTVAARNVRREQLDSSKKILLKTQKFYRLFLVITGALTIYDSVLYVTGDSWFFLILAALLTALVIRYFTELKTLKEDLASADRQLAELDRLDAMDSQ